MGLIFDRVETDKSWFLFQEVIRSKTYCKQIVIARIPANWRDIFFSLFFIWVTPNGQHVPFIFSGLKVLPIFIPIIFVIWIFFKLVILYNHSFHNFQATSKTNRIHWRIFFLFFFFLLHFLLLFSLLCIFFYFL